MGSKFKIGLGLAIFFGLFCAANTSAIDYNRTFSGASWYYYTIEKTTSYSDDEMLYVPFEESNTEKIAVPAKTCQSYGGFWALLKNGYKEGSNGETVLSGKPVSATVLSDVYYKDATWPATGYTAFKGPSDHQTGPSDGNGSGVSATAFGEMDSVLAAYNLLSNTSAVPQTVDGLGDLSYFCASSDPSNIPNVPADFVSFSTVSINENYTSVPVVNGQGYISEPIVVDITKQQSISVTFRHYFAKSLEHKLKDDVSIPYSLGDGDSGSIQTGSMDARFDIGGVNYYAASVEKTVSLDVSSGKDITYCQAVDFNNNTPVSYNLADYSVNSSSGKAPASSSACVSIHVITTSPKTVSSCEEGGDGEVFKDKNGNTVAGNSVMGSTITTVGISKNGEDLTTTTAASRNDLKLIYTKPGDKVQFSYALCFGAHNVSGASTIGVGNSNNHADIFEVHVGQEGKTKREDLQYLFGRADGLLGQTIYVWPDDIKDGTINFSEKGSFYYFGEHGTKVPVGNGDYVTIDNTKKQISFASPDDRPGSQVYAPVIVGGTLSQSLVYQDLAVWPEYLSNYWSTRAYNEPSRDYAWGNIKLQGEIESYKKAYEDYTKNGYTSPSGKHLFAEEEFIKTVGAATPYNFETRVDSEISNHPASTVQPGDKIKVSGYIDILPRINPLTSDKNEAGELVPYATATPVDTKVEVIELVIRDTVNINDDKTYSYVDKYGTHKATLREILNNETKDKFTNNAICSMYQYYLGVDLGECNSTIVKGNYKSIEDEELKVVGNPNSNPEGEMGYFDTKRSKESIERIVPDVEAGYKYCVAIGINHGDSHNLPGQTLTAEDAANNEYSFSSEADASVRTTWKTSKFSCRTITKEPNFQIWNGGAYADGGISAVISEKAVNTKVSSNLTSAKDKKYLATSPSVFGSWAEYFMISKSSITGMASASALGYRSPFAWNETDKNGNVIAHTDYFAANGFGLAPANYCTLSHLTIANTECENNRAGRYASGDTDNSALESAKKRILNYYTDDRPGISKGEYSVITPEDYGEKVNGASFLKISGPFAINSQIAKLYGEGTLIIKVDGRLTINQNICIGSGICQENYPDRGNKYTENTNNLSLSYRNSDLISNGNLDTIPQVILIAENIDIGPEVSQIDAWLITDSAAKNYDGGTINTCSAFEARESGANTCWKTLKINGPVFTANLMLNRTGGAWPGFAGDVGNPAYDILYKVMNDSIAYSVAQAESNPYHPISIEAAQYCSASLLPEACQKNRIRVIAKQKFLEGKSEKEAKAYEHSEYFSAEKSTISANHAASRDLTCDGSITPAEIFDLHPITYYWALAESQKSHQAVITYAQEFAPRY